MYISPSKPKIISFKNENTQHNSLKELSTQRLEVSKIHEVNNVFSEWMRCENTDTKKVIKGLKEGLKKYETKGIFDTCYVARDVDNRIVGLIAITKLSDTETNKSAIYINYLLSDPYQKKSGIGTKLLKRVALKAQKTNIECLKLNSVHSAESFYLSLGFLVEYGADMIGNAETISNIIKK